MDLRKEDRQIERRKCVLHAVNDPEKEIFYLSSYLRHSSATRLVYLAKLVETNSFIKTAQIFGDFWAILKSINYAGKTAVFTFWATSWGEIRLLFVPISGHTADCVRDCG